MDMKELQAFGTIQTIAKDDVVYFEEEKNFQVFLVIAGTVGLYYNVLKQEPVKKATLTVGDFFGEMSLLDSSNKNIETAIAETDAVLLSVNRLHFLKFAASQPDISLSIIKTLNARIKALFDENALLKKLVLSTPNTPNAEAAAAIEKTESQSTSQKLGNVLRQMAQGDDETADDAEHLLEIKKYNIIAPVSYQALVIERKFVCPLCGHESKEFIPKPNKLFVIRTENDFRKRYQDFEPLWYHIVCCPHCNYADFEDSFSEIRDLERKNMLAKRYKGNEIIFQGHAVDRTIDDVILTYFLAIDTEKLLNPNPAKLAKLWHELSWIFGDTSDEVMTKKAAKNALMYYMKANVLTSAKTSIREDQTNHLVMGELCLRAANAKQAYLHFNYVVSLGNAGNFMLLKQAEESLKKFKTT